MKSRNQIIGVIGVGFNGPGRHLSDMDLRQLMGYANELALAIHNAELWTAAEDQKEELAAKNRHLHAMATFSSDLNAAGTTEQVINAVKTNLESVLGYSEVVVYLKEGDILVDTEGNAPRKLELDGPAKPLSILDNGPWQDLFSSDQDYIVLPCSGPRMGHLALHDSNVPSTMLVAMKCQSHVVGALSVKLPVSTTPNDPNASTLVSLARQAGTALRSAMLIDAVRTSEERLRLLVTSLTETLYSLRIYSGNPVPVFFSPGISVLSGYEPDEALQMSDFVSQLVHPDDRELVTRARHFQMAGHSEPFEYRVCDKSGNIRWVIDSPAAIKNEAGQVTRINGSMLDITERKRLEDRLRQAQRMETVGTLAGGIAHEFNNLLAIIQGNVEFAKEDLPPNNPAQGYLDNTVVAIDRAAGLTGQLLAFSRRREACQTVVGLTKVVLDTLRYLEPSLGKGVNVVLKLSPVPDIVRVDVSQFEQVLVNLCVNARDAMPKGGTLTIRTEVAHFPEASSTSTSDIPPGDYACLRVTDTGTGIEKTVKGRVFEPFFTTKPVGRGTGLGLAVAYGIITDHHGWVEVESKPGRGASFSVYLPIFIGTPEPEKILVHSEPLDD